MKKSLTIVLSFLFLSFQSVKADIGLGITGGLHFLEASGTETTRTSNQKNTGEHSEEAYIPELFGEFLFDNGGALGLSYIPTGSMGSKSRSDTNSEGDTGHTMSKLENVFQI